MGCDIHVAIESRYKDANISARWECEWLDAHVWRNYDLFGAMAGVRREDPAHIPPRGIPADCSEEVRKWVDEWGLNGHSHSWLTPDEFEAALKRADSMSGKPAVILALLRELEAEINGWKHARIVFFFDN